ncbi:MAG: transposase [Pseudoxanthomonas sp.]
MTVLPPMRLSNARTMVMAEPASQHPLPGLADHHWTPIAAALPGRVAARARNGGSARRYVESVLWIAQSRASWCDIPAEYGHWHTNYIRFGRWCEDGLWQRVIVALENHPEAQAALQGLVTRYSDNVAMRRERRRMRALRAQSAQ